MERFAGGRVFGEDIFHRRGGERDEVGVGDRGAGRGPLVAVQDRHLAEELTVAQARDLFFALERIGGDPHLPVGDHVELAAGVALAEDDLGRLHVLAVRELEQLLAPDRIERLEQVRHFRQLIQVEVHDGSFSQPPGEIHSSHRIR